MTPAALLAFLFVLAPAAPADPPAGYPFLHYDEGLRRAAAENRRIFLYCGRYGCAFCERANQESFTDAEVWRRYTAHYVLVYADSESGGCLTLPSGERITELELGVRLRAKVTPLFAFFEPDGTKILSVPGFQTARDFLAYDRFIDGGHYQRTGLNDFLKQQP